MLCALLAHYFIVILAAILPVLSASMRYVSLLIGLFRTLAKASGSDYPDIFREFARAISGRRYDRKKDE